MEKNRSIRTRARHLNDRFNLHYFGQAYAIFPDGHADPKEIWRIVKALNANAWPHLFRETRGGEIVREDERKGTVSVFTVYRVKHALDLEKETTAWNYISRCASEVVKEEGK